MKLLGFNFTKIGAEKFSDEMKGVKISTNIDLSDIETTKLPLFKGGEEILIFKFKFSLDYELDLAKIEFEGNTLLAVEPKTAKNILKDWRDKKIADDVKLAVFNLILRKSHLKALQLEEELNLPIHFQLPSLKKADGK